MKEINRRTYSFLEDKNLLEGYITEVDYWDLINKTLIRKIYQYKYENSTTNS